jgi:hypothetical protein
MRLICLFETERFTQGNKLAGLREDKPTSAL